MYPTAAQSKIVDWLRRIEYDPCATCAGYIMKEGSRLRGVVRAVWDGLVRLDGA
jgi:hypothetical protein